MLACFIESLEDLQNHDPGQFGIPTPPLATPIEPCPQVVIVPGLAFTQAGQRLGMGGGHYDRYLTDHPGTFSIAVCYDWQVLDGLPSEPHDMPVKMIVTESRVVACSTGSQG